MTWTLGAWTTNTGTPVTGWIEVTYGPPPADDDGLAGVREPRNPDLPPDCLVAARGPDGEWYIPLTGGPSGALE